MLDRTTEMNTEVEIELTAGGLHEALRRVRHAMCREETRYYLDGVYLHHVARVGALRFVATDGHRSPRLILARPKVPKPSVP